MSVDCNFRVLIKLGVVLIIHISSSFRSFGEVPADDGNVPWCPPIGTVFRNFVGCAELDGL